ncbi:uncharacterized protein LOC124480338 [Hypomesus transpacificus]|uniref:uncharacterized protein LOC124480338 n=2 Tax=Hypomesus transpacificus TaxID=137520 RepID=UPI001F0865E4|nr:uncharacterized protein LOC124480338 [Hypomesus transpacificus]
MMSDLQLMELEDELKSVDTFLEHLKTEETEKNRQKTKTTSPKPVHWKKRDHNGDIVHQRPRALRKQSTSQRPDEGRHVSSSPPLDHGQHLDHDLNMRQLEDLLQDSENMESQDFVQQPPLSSWSQRQKEVQQCWQQARPQNLDNLLSAENIVQMTCNHCHVKEAVIRCGECMPSEWFCAECDGSVHKHHTLHNRQTIMDGFFKYIPPTEAVTLCDTGKYSICEQDCFLPTALPQRICSCDTADAAVSTLFHQDLFHSFEAMNTAAPGMSRQAFTAMLDQRTKQYGRTGKVNADAFQRSFLQFVYCNYEENQLLGKEPLVCPACSPEMVAVSVDGNRKLYRFQKTNQSEEPGFFDGVFLARDSEVSSFVEEVRGTVKSTAGKAMCGDTQWNAARETSKRANNLDEEGVEFAVCRHGFLLKGLNMYRGEIFAYPMFLQKEFQSATFLAMDVTCRYVPYLTKVSEALTHLQPLQEMRHCLSVMHAKAHNTKCEILWTARNQEGAGTTLGEEVEQVNSFLSRCALTTKYMAKSVRTDMLTVHAMGWNERKENGLHIALSSRFKKTVEKTVDVAESLKTMQEQLHCCDDMLKQWVVDVKQWASSRSTAPGPVDAQSLQITIEALFVSICQKKHYLYRQNDRNKRRQKITQKIAQEKKRLLEDIQRYNQQPDGDPVDTELVVQKLSNKAAESMIWPWQEQNTDGVDILTKKKLFDHVMLASRLKEEKQILVKEMLQHCQYLKDSVAKVQTLMGTVLVSTQTGSLPNGLTEEGSKGLISALKRRLQDLRLKQQTIAGTYRCTLKPSNRLVEEEDREMEEDMDWQRGNSSDDDSDEEEDAEN